MTLHSLRFASVAAFAAIALPAILAACGAPFDLAPVTPCDDPRPVQVRGAYTGYDTCSGGSVHRSKIVACSLPEPVVGKCDATGPAAEPATCHTNAECAKLASGLACGTVNPEVPCNCVFSCVNDSDCGNGYLCVCDEPFSICKKAICRSDADCGGNRRCVESVLDQCEGPAFACQSPLDECLTSLDCADQLSCLLGADHRVCARSTCNHG